MLLYCSLKGPSRSALTQESLVYRVVFLLAFNYGKVTTILLTPAAGTCRRQRVRHQHITRMLETDVACYVCIKINLNVMKKDMIYDLIWSILILQ